MATHSSILAWRTPWTEEPDGLQSTGLQRVGHDGVTKIHMVSPQLKKPSLPHQQILARPPALTGLNLQQALP